MVKDRQAWGAAAHEVAKSQTWLSNWTTRIRYYWDIQAPQACNPCCSQNSLQWSLTKRLSPVGILDPGSYMQIELSIQWSRVWTPELRRPESSPAHHFPAIWVWVAQVTHSRVSFPICATAGTSRTHLTGPPVDERRYSASRTKLSPRPSVGPDVLHLSCHLQNDWEQHLFSQPGPRQERITSGNIYKKLTLRNFFFFF